MATKRELSELLFLDSAYAVALASPGDEFHSAAADLAAEIRRHRARLLTTEAVLLEIGDSMSKPRFRPAAVSLLQGMRDDPLVEILPLSRELVHDAFNLFRQRLDKAWGLTDCVSFLVMKQRGVRQALTTDEHFQQAGFEALLRQ